MKLSLSPTLPKKETLLVVPLFLDAKKLVTKDLPKPLQKIIANRLAKKDLEEKDGSECLIISDDEKLAGKILLHVCGEVKKWSSAKERNFAASATKEAKKYKTGHVTFLYDHVIGGFPQSLAEGVGLAAYQMGRLYKTGKAAEELKKTDIAECVIVTSSKGIIEPLQKGLLLAEAACHVRDLINAPANIMHPKRFAEEAKKTAKENGIDVKIFEKKELVKMKMGGLLAVNAGSTTEEQAARLIVMEYLPLGRKVAPVVFVGKGINFDTGGYNMKPGKYMDTMQLDKSGASTILGVFEVLKKLKVKKNVVGIMLMTENLVSATAYKPNDIITMYDGKTVEILNTDAEGRMILADGVAYGAKQYKPRYMIDLATLTGACVVALGERYAGLFSNDKTLAKLLKESGRNTDELLWSLPMHADDCKKMKSKIADLRNSDEGTAHAAGATKGAAFIKEFIGKTKWAHLDIAGTAFVDDPKPYDYPKATGFGVRLLIDFLENLE